MVQKDGTIQSTVKSVCSISYVSEKLQVSRPSLYKYMDLYDSGDRRRIPERVLDFFDFLRSGRRTEDDAILYFIKNKGSVRTGEPECHSGLFGVECIVGGDGAMIMFPDCRDPSEVTVEVLADFDGTAKVIGEYRAEPGRRFVRVGDLVPGHTFYYRVRTSDGDYVIGNPVPFSIGD